MTKLRDNCLIEPDVISVVEFTESGRRCYFAHDSCMKCQVCEESVPFPLGDLNWVKRVMRAFQKAHENCEAKT